MNMQPYASRMNVKEEVEKLQQFIRHQVEVTGANGLVIGISGGIDSTVAAYLAVRALGKEKVLGVLLPSHTTPEEDQEDAAEVVRRLGLESAHVPIADIIACFGNHLPEFDEGSLPKANLQARVRMCIVYYFANLKNYLVCGTTDASENFLGYYTKYGDGAADIEPLIKLTKTEVKSMAKELGVHEKIIRKKSSPNLKAGHDAEEELGVSYEMLDRLLAKNKMAEHKKKPPVSP
jgi:NAD+ synthase